MEKRVDLQEFYKGLDLVFQKKDSSETLRYLESWLRVSEERNDAYGIVAVCNELGGLCRALGRMDRAIELYRRVLFHLEQIGLGNTEHYATALINMGDVYIAGNDPGEALTLFLKAKKLLEDCGLGGDYRMAALCNNISAVYRKTDRFEEAESALDIAFRIIKGLPQCRAELATTYVNLGELQVRQNKLEMAKESFLAAVKIYEEETGGQDVHYSAACAGLGQVFFLVRNFSEAERYYNKALDLIQRDFGKTPYYDLVASNLDKVRAYAQGN